MQNHPLMPNGRKIYDPSVDDINNPRQFVKKHHGTYNILGVIRIEMHQAITDYSGSGIVKNTKNYSITLWWVKPQYEYTLPNVNIRHRKKLFDIKPGHEGRYRCMINHKFIITSGAHPYARNASIIKIFKSTKQRI